MKTTFMKTGILSIFFFSVINIMAQDNYTDNKTIISLIEKKRIYNKKNGSGFKIQLYNGSEAKAKTIKARFKKHYYWVNTKLEFDSPDWKVQVGNYQTRLEADRALNKFSKKFNGAIIVEK